MKPHAPLPEGPFRVFLADPPWPYDNKVSRASAEDHYDTMTLEEIQSMGPSIWEAAEADAACFMWATSPLLPDCVQTLARWGFRYTTVAFVWVKVGVTAVDISDGFPPGRELVVLPGEKGGPRFPRYGVGNYTRPGMEMCLLGTRGRMSVPKSDVAQVVFAPLGEHSEKPVEVHRRIQRMYPTGDRLELFARTPRFGFQAWGDEVHGRKTRTKQ